MIHLRQGDLQEARTIFDRAETRLKNQIISPGTDDLARGGPENYIIMDIFRREAENAFEQK
jgi:hypothetical protein